MPDSEAASLYANSMSRIYQRVGLVRRVLDRQCDLGSEAFDTELVYLQFRKILEEIAFSSLAANRTEYAALHANFSKHWKAEKILQELGKLNPEFYPQPLEAPTSSSGLHHFDRLSSDFLAREEFAALYDISSQVMHTRNPYSQDDSVIQARYSGDQWVQRIQRLLSWHSVQLLNGEVLVVNIPPSGDVHVYPASAGIAIEPLQDLTPAAEEPPLGRQAR